MQPRTRIVVKNSIIYYSSPGREAHDVRRIIIAKPSRSRRSWWWSILFPFAYFTVKFSESESAPVATGPDIVPPGTLW